jgi:hypothetical protein
MTRSCRTCRWYRPDDDGASGTCANADLEQELGFQALVRAKELHCRRGWNDDRWRAAADDIVLDVRFRSPGRGREVGPGNESDSRRPTSFRTAESIVDGWSGQARAEANDGSPQP